MLELEGYEVRCGGEAQGALGIVRRMKPDLIVLDVVLPGLSSLELLKLLNRDRHMKQIPVLMCSDASEVLAKNRAEIDSSGVRALAKPFTLDGLVQAVRERVAQGQRSASA